MMSVAQNDVKFTEVPPLGLYIHFPWCVEKCPYCDFNSHALKKDLPEKNYITALMDDFQQSLTLFPNLAQRTVRSVFLGGGTPSLFSGECLASLLEQIQTSLVFAEDVEITLEANPGTLEHGRFEAYRRAGINRLSLGIQSFDNAMLKSLGRIHNSQDALVAIDDARAAGFTRLNLDLMFALPQQTIKQAFIDLDKALACKPDHLSWYQLTLEPNTAFYRENPPLPTHDDAFTMYQFGSQKIKEHGFENYEVSAYAKPTQQCRHNVNYWQYGDYLGIGAGAHSKITNLDDHSITRCMKIKHPKRYLAADKDYIQSQQSVNPHARAFEFMLNALRLNSPMPLTLFTERTGLAAMMIESPLKAAIAQGMLTNKDGVIHKTNLGERFVDEVVQLFLHS